MVWVGRDGDNLLISTAAGRRKERNLHRDPRASLTVYDPADPLRYAEIRGLATITEDTSRALAVTLAEQYEGPGAGQEYLDIPSEVLRGRPHHPDQGPRLGDPLDHSFFRWIDCQSATAEVVRTTRPLGQKAPAQRAPRKAG